MQTTVRVSSKRRRKIDVVQNLKLRLRLVLGRVASTSVAYPEVDFVSVDLQPDLAQHNKLLPQHPNWRFVSGYALDLLERGDLAVDLALFSSTSVLFRDGEMDAYVAALARSTKVVVFNEPWWAPLEGRLGRLLRPEEIDPNRARLAGRDLCHLHNYPAILQRHGFAVRSSEISDTNKDHHVLQIVAVRAGRG